MMRAVLPDSKKRLLLVVASCVCLLLGQNVHGQTNGKKPQVLTDRARALVDSVWQRFTLEDLLEFRTHYRQKTEELLAQKARMRADAIADLETFLHLHPGSPVLDQVIVRLAEMYIEQASYDFAARSEEYNRLLEQYDAGQLKTLPKEPQKDFSRPFALYQMLLDKFPQSELVDDVLYSRAFLLEDLGQTDQALTQYQNLVQAWPESPYVPNALMRIAEYYFNPPNSDLEKAIAYYNRVLEYKESPNYDAALYRLGWAYYTLTDYPSAIAYFTLLADDVDRMQKLDPQQKYHFPAVRDEAIEYVGISFVDFGGPERAAAFLQQIGGRRYGFDILKKIADSYLEAKEDIPKAITAYELLLRLYPDAPEVPRIEAQLADAYERLNDEEHAYAHRRELFQRYRSGMEAPDTPAAPDFRRETGQLAAKAMRENINDLLRRAETSDAPSLYRQAVEDSRRYLAVFPADSSAPRIHWNLALTLDTRLGEKTQAFDEYVTVSNRYLGSQFQKKAAENAVAIADELLAQQAAQDSAAAGATTRDSTMFGGDLSPAEQRLAFALDNFIKLFPQDEETPAMLSKAGALYYQRRDFKHALRYFKTLTKHFPHSDQAAYARFITMESYFGKGDYKSAEIVADRLRAQSPEFAERANQRLAQAIFLQAKAFADSLDHLRAAREFQRMVATTPEAEFVDLALFNAAEEYDKLPDYTKAIVVYQQLLAQHPQSEYRLSALNNLAFDYHEIGDFEDAAVRYRELADATPDSSQAATALYNASVSYVEAENWREAIAVNNAFADRFPKADAADDLLFDNAKYYLKLQDLESANAIYARFAEKFPDSPRVVEAHYLRGEYFRSQNRLAEARTEYEKALASSESLHASGQEFDDYFTSEALFQLTELTFAEYKGIRFTEPGPALSEKKKKKKDLLLQLVDNYTKVAAFGTPRLYEATYRIGNSYEEFADTWASQEIDATDENARIVARKEISETTARLYQEAVDAYKKGVEVLRRFAHSDSSAPADTSSAGAMARLSAADSTQMHPERWIAKCEEKISEDLFKMAQLGHRTLDDLLGAQIPAGMSKLEQLVYQQQLLKKAIVPTVEKVLQAHANNLSESAALNLENRWVDSSRAQVVFLAKLVPEKLEGLADAALDFYAQRLDEYVSLVEKDDDAAFDLGAELSNLVALATDLALNSAAAYKKAVERVRALQLSDEQISDAEAEMMQRLSEFAVREDSLALAAETKRNVYDQRFKETDAANYEDAFYTLDDLDLSLSDGRAKILKAGFEMAREFELSNPGSQAIVLALLKEHPEQYAAKLGLELDTVLFPSSSDWRASATREPGWTEVSFSDSLWSPAYHEGTATAIADTLASAIWLTELDPTFTAGLDSSREATTISSESALQTDDLSRAIRRPDKVYFRRHFTVSGIPISGRVLLAVDDSSRVYCNGRFVGEFTAPEGSAPAAQTMNIARFLKQGENVVAIEAIDTDGSRGNLEAVVQLWTLQDLEQLRQVLSGESADATGSREDRGQNHMDSNEE